MKGRTFVAALATAMVLGAGAVVAMPAGAASTAPSNVTLSWVRGSVKIAWTTGAEPKDYVEKSTNATSGFTQVGKPVSVRSPGQSKSLKDSKVTPGVTYFYRVRGVVDGRDVVSETKPFTVPGGTTTTTTPPTDPREAAPTPTWKLYGGSSSDYGQRIGVDGAGNVAVGASISTVVNFDGVSVGTNVRSSAIVSLAPNGSRRWAKPVRGDIGALAVAADGTVYAVSAFATPPSTQPPVVVNGVTLPPSVQTYYVVQYGSSGNLVTEKALWTTSGWVIPQSMAVVPGGGLAVSGVASGTVDVGCGATTVAQRTAFVVKLKADGSCDWQKRLPVASEAPGVAVDSRGYVVATGHFNGNLENKTSSGDDMFVYSFKLDGSKNFFAQLGTSGSDRGTAVAIDGTDSVTVAGNEPLTVRMARFTAGGSPVWSYTYAASTYNATLALGLAVDRAGNVAMTGLVVDPVTFGGVNDVLRDANNVNDPDMFVAKFDSRGSHVYSFRSGNAFDDRGTGVVFTPAGGIVGTGYTYGGVGDKTTSQGPDIYVVSIAA